MDLKQFGGRITPVLLQQYQLSANWHDGKFVNLEETKMNIRLRNVPGLIYRQLAGRKMRSPGIPLKVLPFERAEFLSQSAGARYVWYGHSAIMLRLNGQTILIDPMMGPNASPPAPFKTKRFSDHTLDFINDFPEIDIVLISHDHYDHLDKTSILKLKSKAKRYLVALGVKRHLTAWGISPELITEVDWWDRISISGIDVTFTPSRHFSGRGLQDRNRSLWGGFALRSMNTNIIFSGDGGYGNHYAEIGKRLGPFDLAFMECGQYNELWRQIHLMPEESVQAARELNARKAVPVHWAGFSLALHNWQEPAERFFAAAEKLEITATFPLLGKVYGLQDEQKEKWWRDKA
ncbi:MAG TPA: MBL fold metallo-hydrolase [Bacteroidales bacterium]|nr:MBL fold metallo-hydrolase [Bacteroidales bacterium]